MHFFKSFKFFFPLVRQQERLVEMVIDSPNATQMLLHSRANKTNLLLSSSVKHLSNIPPKDIVSKYLIENKKPEKLNFIEDAFDKSGQTSKIAPTEIGGINLLSSVL